MDLALGRSARGLGAAGQALKILYQAGVDLSLPQGNAVHVRRLAQGLESRGQTVRLLSTRPSAGIGWSGPSGGWAHVSGIPVPRLRHVTRELRLSRKARADAVSFEPDVRLIRQELFCFSPLLLPRSQPGGCAGPGAGRGCRRPAPLVLEIHASHGDLTAGQAGGPGNAGGLRAKGARFVEGSALRRADAVVAVTSPLASSLITLHGLDPRRVHVIPNGAWIPPVLGAEIPEIRRGLGADDTEFVLAFAGNLNRVQDLGAVIRALALLPGLPLRLLIAGDGPERTALYNLTGRLGLAGRVQFFGGLPEEDAARMVQAAQAAIVPYRAPLYEALGGESEALKLLQGLACDRPIIVTAARGLDLVERLGAGERIPPDGGAGAWAEGIQRWSRRWESSGRPLRDWPWREGEGPGHRYIAGARTWDHCAAAWVELLEAITASGQ